MSGEISKELVVTCIALLKRLEDHCDGNEGTALRQLTEWLSRMKFPDGTTTEDQNPKLDKTATAYLLQFRDSSRKLPVTRGAFLTGPSADSLSMPARRPSWPLAEGHLQLPTELAKIESWDDFDIFKVNKLTGEKPLEAVAMAVLEDFNLVSSLKLDTTKLTKFIKEIEENYGDNPYHNHIHAADVVQALGVILIQDDLKSSFTDLELLAMLLAAVIHDFRHPGVTNEFLVNSKSQQALVYNDVSVNENMHASTAFRLMQEAKSNVLEVLNEEDFGFVRASMIKMVLATDMAKHDKLLRRFERFYELHKGDLSKWESVAARSALRQMLVHCADISNPARPWNLSSQWSFRIMDEWFNQGDKEKKLCMPLSALGKRDQVEIPKSQVTFLEFVVKPSFKLLSQIAPKIGKMTLDHVDKNVAQWESQMPDNVSANQADGNCGNPRVPQSQGE